jgi:hypothetical protein
MKAPERSTPGATPPVRESGSWLNTLIRHPVRAAILALGITLPAVFGAPHQMQVPHGRPKNSTAVAQSAEEMEKKQPSNIMERSKNTPSFKDQNASNEHGKSADEEHG